MPKSNTDYGPVARAVFAVPVLGWMLRDVAEGGESAMLWFAASVIGVLALVTLVFGLPGLVMAMLPMAAVVLSLILIVAGG